MTYIQETAIHLERDNPFAQVSVLPHHAPAFDRILEAHFAPAFDVGIRVSEEEIAIIANQIEAPTFANTIEALEQSGQLLDRTSRVFFHYIAIRSNDRLEALRTALAPKLAAHEDAIAMNRPLFARIAILFVSRATLSLDAEALRLLERYHRDFVRAGATLDEHGQATLRAIHAELASLTTRFSQNILQATRDQAVWIESEEELEGLPRGAIEAAQIAALERGFNSGFLLTLSNTTEQACLASLARRDVRERVYRASIRRCTMGANENASLVKRIATLRAQGARLLGHPHYAAFILEEEMAGSSDRVAALLGALIPKARANAEREAEQIRALIDARFGGHPLQPWDWSFYSEKVRLQNYAFDQTQLRPYFALNNVLEKGAFFAAHALYGITFERRTDLPTPHPEVTVYEVFDANSQSIGLLMTDYYARENKRGGAWANAYVSQSELLGQFAVVGNQLNIPKPATNEPTLLTFAEVTTLFHEFGHALHGLFSRVRYPRFSGTSVPRDFVEFPSQVNEIWALWPEVLAQYACHFATNEPIPPELIRKVLDASTFNQGFKTVEYLAAAVLDQAWHELAGEDIPEDVEQFEEQVLTRAGLRQPWIAPRYKTCYFQHVFSGGYAARYYAYIWSEVLDADAEQWFRDRGGMTRANGEHLRDEVLKHGGSIDPATLFSNFRGGEPSINALLVRRGLNESAA